MDAMRPQTHRAPVAALFQVCAAVACAGLLLAFPASAATPACPGPGHGKLLLHGGGGASALYVRRAIVLCGRRGVRVVLVPFASYPPYPPDAPRATVEPGRRMPAAAEELARDLRDWTDAGARDVTRLALSDLPTALAAIGEADYIFFGSGDQAVLMDWMNHYPEIGAAIARRHAEGALLGGSSAGTAAMSHRMIIGGASGELTAVRSGGTPLAEGLGFWPDVMVDQHFVVRQRWARLISAVLDHPALLGVAVDERTAILVGPSHFEVSGEGTVVVIDARQAHIDAAAAGQVQAGRRVRLSMLRAGDRFDWLRHLRGRCSHP